MDKTAALEIVKPHLTEHRYIHTVGVMETAVYLADKIGNLHQNEVELAAIFHDYAKFRDKEEMRSIIRQQEYDKKFIDYGDELLHAPAGAYLVKTEIGIDNEEILSAIFWHTTGKEDMNNLEKVLFLADYIEPNRIFPGVEEVRRTADENIDEAVVMALRNTITFLMKKQQSVFPKTLYAYNDMVYKIKRKANRGG
ncbi:putative HD superfamily hydrolase of NAD metabolism [Alteribacillus persepolensis]|uniref:bis(5'-nucleosyl)-tetraphosphatase (symmetrical) n=1 Tax=Alteribacillus persepolensis TaxID=568899 RepID=A0A1G8CMT3_9BACI|nr:bis(5'-nucleosyl)-tetraphosphatase (symmetrical) YqeK [Alteribacillus persepolensis]SDH46778.1 putative HD superfamily hydrolase of NAD metabolism [Alteribacillus persepolensis]